MPTVYRYFLNVPKLHALSLYVHAINMKKVVRHNLRTFLSKYDAVMPTEA